MITYTNQSSKELKYLIIKGIRREVERHMNPYLSSDDDIPYDTEEFKTFQKFCIDNTKLLDQDRDYDFSTHFESYFRSSIDNFISMIKTTDDKKLFDLLYNYNECMFETA
jgi:hypothetical protein